MKSLFKKDCQLQTVLPSFDRCVICSEPFTGGLADLAKRRLEHMTCGKAECQKANEVRTGRLCCEKATYMPCSCAQSYTCPDHGEKHFGTHD